MEDLNMLIEQLVPRGQREKLREILSREENYDFGFKSSLPGIKEKGKHFDAIELVRKLNIGAAPENIGSVTPKVSKEQERIIEAIEKLAEREYEEQKRAWLKKKKDDENALEGQRKVWNAQAEKRAKDNRNPFKRMIFSIQNWNERRKSKKMK